MAVVLPQTLGSADIDTPGETQPATVESTTTTSSTTTVPTTTTTLPEYGAGLVGPAWERATTEGLLVDESNYPEGIESADSGETVLLAGGEYSGGFSVPEGVTVKPYNGELVTIDGQVSMDSGSTLAGLRLTSADGWVVRVDSDSSEGKSDVTIRHNQISGGEIEAIRISRNVRGVVIVGNDISGGGNHNVKVHGEGSGYLPSATIRNNRIHDALSEDGIQTEDNGPVIIDHNTIWGAPENGLDIKTGEQVTVTNNIFDGETLLEVALLVHHYAFAVVEDNQFTRAASVMLGSLEFGDPAIEFRSNHLDGGGFTLRRSFVPAIVQDNTWIGGFLMLGWTIDDHPRDARIVDNTFQGTEFTDRVSEAGDAYVCSGNTFVETTGELPQCETG